MDIRNALLVFTSLYHHIADIEHLRACYQLLKGNKAVGVDEVTKSMYAEDLELYFPLNEMPKSGW